jgi:hypothetical protein
MTDVEYYKLMLLFEQKAFNMQQIAALLRWIDSYTVDPDSWASPSDLIDTLNECYPDRPGYKQSG